MPARRLLLLLFSIFVAIALIAAGCGNDDDEPAVPAPAEEPAPTEAPAPAEEPAPTEAPAEEPADIVIDVGGGMNIVFPAGTTPNVGFFSTTGNDLLNVFIPRLQDRVRELGGEVTFFDAGFDPAAQLSQLENAMVSGDFNTWIITPLDGNLVCALLTEDAPAAGILVATTILPACGRDLNPAGDELWSPGTLTMVGGENTVNYKIGWLREIYERLPQDARVAVLTGPELIGNTVTYEDALVQIEPSRPDVEILVTARTDFTTPDALAKMENILQANSDLDAVVSLYSDITRGVIQAIDEADREGIQVYDLGASTYSVEQIRTGAMELTAPYDPVGQAVLVVDAVFDAFAGEAVDRFIDSFPSTTGGTVDEPFFIDSTNVDEYEPQY